MREYCNSHHPLILCDIDRDVSCFWCKMAAKGPIYTCRICEFFLHKLCAELPLIIESHPFHSSCQLTLFEWVTGSLFCNSCHRVLKLCSFHCARCKFNMCVSCALEVPVEAGREKIQHFSHAHPLTLCDVGDSAMKVEGGQGDLFVILEPGRRSVCFACQKHCSGPTYNCIPCEYSLHKSCAELQYMVNGHPFHSCHPLILTVRANEFQCNSCYIKRRGFTYCCLECHFDMDSECVLMPTQEYEAGQEQISHFSHQHPLILVDNDQDHPCYACSGLYSNSPIYGCILCKYYIHKSCSELTPRIESILHPCPLTLCSKTSPPQIQCEACLKYIQGFSFQCERCQAYLHIECAQMGSQLTLCEKRDDEQVYCSACTKTCSGLTYGLSGYFLHKSCADLPKEIHQHPFHPQHTLTLRAKAQRLRSNIYCNACLRIYSGYTYNCEFCNFDLDVECALLKPTIKFQGHPSHLLTFFEKIYHAELVCNTCGTACESSVFRCVECNFNLHLLCGPLPLTIPYLCEQWHPLKLTDIFVDDGYDEDVCDVCQSSRDRRMCVYCCAPCKYCAHVNCVKSEVIRSVRGELGDVNLRTVGTSIMGKAISKGIMVKEMGQIGAEQDKETNSETAETEGVSNTNIPFYEIVNSMTVDERNEARSLVNRRVIYGSPREDNDIPNFLDPDKAFTQLMERLESGIIVCQVDIFSELKFLIVNESTRKYNINEKSKVVIVGDWKIVQPLVSILKELLDKYGDISVESMLSPGAKCVYFHLLCAVVYSMRKTRVVDINENLLRTWWDYLKAVQRAGFEVKFIIDRLKTVARAYFGLRAERFKEDTFANQEKETAQLEKEMKEIETKLKVMKVENNRHRINVESAIATSFMKECLSEASKMKWNTADEGLF